MARGWWWLLLAAPLLSIQPAATARWPSTQEAGSHVWVPRALASGSGLGTGGSGQEQCLLTGLSSVLQSCPGYDPGNPAVNRTGNMRDSMIRLLQSCLLTRGTNSTNETTRILMPFGLLGNVISNLTATYQQATGISVQPVFAADYLPARSSSIRNPTNQSLTHDAWLITPSGMGDGLASGAFMDLGPLILYDQRLQWQGLLNQMRAVGLVYGSKVLALPISAYSFQLFYRMDTFQANNWTVPVTWRGLVELAHRINGTNDLYGFCGIWGVCGALGTNLFKYILASYHQTGGATDGWLIDPDTMQPLTDSPAVKETLEIIQALYQISPPDTQPVTNCSQGFDAFVMGQCHMTIFYGLTFKYVSHISNARFVGSLQGNLGVASLPGSYMVLDRPSNTLVPCNERRCPFATRTVLDVDGTDTTVWVNQSPGFEALLAPINDKSPSTTQFYTFSVMSYLLRPDVSDALVLHPLAESLPTRNSQLDPAKWQAAGYNAADSARYCASHSSAMTHPNLHVQIRVPGAPNFVALFYQLSSMVMAGNTTEDIAALAHTQSRAILSNMARGNATNFRQIYWSSINKVVPPPPPSQPPANAQGSATVAADNTKKNITIILSTVIPTAIIVAAALIAWRILSARHADDKGPPGVGPDTTLLVTDIEGSTSLWEELDPSVMELAGRLHDTTIRKLITKHKGYETVWEGDSFVVAFASAIEALNFSLEVQKVLLHLEWPAALLAHERAEEVWVALAKSHAKAETEVVQAVLHQTYANSMNHSRPTWGSAVNRSVMLPTADKQEPQPEPVSLSVRASAGGGPPSKLPTVFQENNEHDSAAEEEEEEGEDANSSLESSLSRHDAADDKMEAAYSVISSMRELSQVGQSLLEERVIDGRRWSLRNKWSHKWTVTNTASSSAVLVFRGLRVRIGFHSGLTVPPEYNKNSRRYLYSGAIRIISNAVAFAGHGGFIMMSNTTSQRLGMDSQGALRLLPSDVQVYHMGNHVLADVPGDPMELMLIIPTALKCILGVQQAPLRTLQCVVPGVLDAPAPPPAWAAGLLPMPVLVAVQFTGLSVLLDWDKNEALEAVRTSLRLVNEQLADWNGVMSEDGLSLLIYNSGLPEQSRLTTFRDTITPGRIVTAFSDAGLALRWALSLRHRLLTHEWSTKLLTHEMCETVGVLSDVGVNQTICHYRELSATGDQTCNPAERGDVAASGAASMRIRQFAISFGGAPSYTAGQSHHEVMHGSFTGHPRLALGSVTGMFGEQNLPDAIGSRSRVSMRSERTAGSETAACVPQIHLDLDFGDEEGDGVCPAACRVVGRAAGGGSREDLGLPQARVPSALALSFTEPHARSHTHSFATGTSEHMPIVHSSLPAALRKSRGSGGGAVKFPPLNVSQTGSSGLSDSFVRRHPSTGSSGMQHAGIADMGKSTRANVSAPVLPSMDGSRVAHAELAAGNLYAFDAAMLRGIRVRIGIASGPSDMHVAVNSSGRPMYRGSALKHLQKLLKQAHTGQVLVTGKVMQQADV